MAQIVDHVVVFTQENHTTDNYFSSMRAWGQGSGVFRSCPGLGDM
jgi:phospholipase C